jgi:hypothetical protein
MTLQKEDNMTDRKKKESNNATTYQLNLKVQKENSQANFISKMLSKETLSLEIIFKIILIKS